MGSSSTVAMKNCVRSGSCTGAHETIGGLAQRAPRARRSRARSCPSPVRGRAVPRAAVSRSRETTGRSGGATADAGARAPRRVRWRDVDAAILGVGRLGRQAQPFDDRQHRLRVGGPGVRRELDLVRAAVAVLGEDLVEAVDEAGDLGVGLAGIAESLLQPVDAGCERGAERCASRDHAAQPPHVDRRPGGLDPADARHRLEEQAGLGLARRASPCARPTTSGIAAAEARLEQRAELHGHPRREALRQGDDLVVARIGRDGRGPRLRSRPGWRRDRGRRARTCAPTPSAARTLVSGLRSPGPRRNGGASPPPNICWSTSATRTPGVRAAKDRANDRLK